MRKINRLLLRLFGSDCTDCMNLGNSTGLLTQIQSRNNEGFKDLSDFVDDINDEVEQLKKDIKKLQNARTKKSVKKPIKRRK